MMNFNDFSFNANLAKAQTIPTDWYLVPEILAFEQSRIFGRTWQLTGRLDQISSPGEYFTTTIANEPLIVVRTAANKIRALSNVCRHRAGPVTKGAGQCKVFQCRYHGWTYSTEGQLLGTPDFDGVENFNRADFCLPEFKVECWNGLIFVNLDSQAASLSDYLEDIPSRIAHHNLIDMKFAARKDWYIDCNWKVYVDNYLEGYHIPLVHPALNHELDYRNYQIETGRWSSIQHSPIKQNEATRLKADNGITQAQYFWLFPNLMLNVYPNNYSTNLIVPLSPNKTLTIFEWYFRNPDVKETKQAIRRTVEFSDEIQIEDIEICEAVQRGLQSATYQSGRYSVKRENGLHHFHKLLSEMLLK